MNIDLRLGDCIEVLRTLPDNSVDSIVTDPPYGIGFMNKEWDSPQKLRQQQERDLERTKIRKEKGDAPVTASFSPFPGQGWKGVKEARWFQNWCQEWATECLRVLKPGGHILSFSAPRMYHRMTTGFEDAGFEIRDQLMWVFGSGFPKSHNIGKAIDKIQGNEREVVGVKENKINLNATKEGDKSFYENAWNNKEYIDLEITKGHSNWEGWGTALKPAHEPIVMARKPLSEKSVAENVLKWGTGGINIDDCRIGNEIMVNQPAGDNDVYNTTWKGSKTEPTITEGRFPANIMFDEEAGKLLDQQSGTLKSGYVASHHKTKDSSWYGASGQYSNNSTQKNDLVGGASRFFYCPKVSKKERDMGLNENMPLKQNIFMATKNGTGEASKGMERFATEPKKNHHPTVKPIKLMEYLITLVTPKGGVVLDCFMGSGSTGIAARNKGFKFIGIEKEQEYMDIAKQRITSTYQTKLDI